MGPVVKREATMATKERKQPVKGYEIWRGPSAFDGEPIVLIATFIKGANANSKTGPMVQTWILPQLVSPVHALRTGADDSVCGDCKLRPQGEWGKGRSCYVHSGMLDTIYSTWKRGRYPIVETGPDDHRMSHFLAGRELRIGSYGDPLAVPHGVWKDMLLFAEHWTGYTHAWRWLHQQCADAKADGISSRSAAGVVEAWQALLMASVQGEDDRADAKALGWRTFRTMTHEEEPVASFDAMIGKAPEVICPASKEGRYRSTCRECQLCDGVQGVSDKRRDVAIYVHGWGTATSNYRRMRASLNVLQDNLPSDMGPLDEVLR